MPQIKIGCQAYTWEMLGAQWHGTFLEIVQVVAQAGYQGVEASWFMLDDYLNQPDLLKEELARRQLQLPALGYASEFTNPAKSLEEIAQAEKVLKFIQNFPGSKLILAGGSTESIKDLDRKFQVMCDTYNIIGKQGKSLGIPVAIHPHSHHGSIIEAPHEYQKLMRLTDPHTVYLSPDTGHIVRSGANLLEIIKTHRERIIHLHFKDVDAKGQWALLGEGVCDFQGVLNQIATTGYDGWVIAEEESNFGGQNPLEAINCNRQYLKSLGY